MKRSIGIVGIIFFLLIINPAQIWAVTQEKEETVEAFMQEDILEELEFESLDNFMKELGKDITFYELLEQILADGWNVDAIEQLTKWLWGQLFSELHANKKLFLEVLLITFCFSLLKNSVGTFGSAYMSDSCFLLVYSVLAVLLLKSVYLFQYIVAETLEQCVTFMKIFVPCFCTGMFFSSNTYSSSGFYQLAFLVIYLVEGAFKIFLLPCIHMYILLQVFNHFFEEGQFGNFAELLETIVNWGLRIALTAVLGLSAVQNLINPVKDRMAQGAIGRTAAAIPAVGNVVGSVGELILGTGMMIKNGIGVAGIVVLVLIGRGPLIKTCLLAFSYKIMAAVTEPLSDRRISSCIMVLSKGTLLYTRLLGEGMVLFLVMIALAVSATSFVY